MDKTDTSGHQPIEGYLKLLLAFSALPHTSRSRTFMDVSGYPHYENVASNILAFYFDPEAEHDLRDLLITAFLRMAKKEAVTPGPVSVIREHDTGNGRLDLLIEAESFILAIENKIYHWLANDLDDYAKTVHSRAKEKQVVIKAVLGLQPANDEALKGGFVSYTYGQLWENVRSLLGCYVPYANQKWCTYLFDFMETTTNLAGQNMEIKQTDRFFIDHHEAIERMLAERNAFLGRLTSKIVMLVDLMTETTEAAALSRPPYLYSKDRLVLDFAKLGGNHEVAFDFYLTPAGWDLQLFGRGAKSYEHLLKLVKQPALEGKMRSATLRDKRFYVQKWDVAADLDEIRESLRGWLSAVSTAEKTLQ